MTSWARKDVEMERGGWKSAFRWRILSPVDRLGSDQGWMFDVLLHWYQPGELLTRGLLLQ